MFLFILFFFLRNALIRFVILEKRKKNLGKPILREFHCINCVIYLEIKNLKYFKRKDRRNTYILFYKFMNYKNNLYLKLFLKIIYFF